MKTLRMSFLWFLLLALHPSAHAFDGPLQVRNQFPLFLIVNAPSFEQAAMENSLSAGFSYSSIYLVRESSRWSVGLDMEIAEFNLRLRKTLGDFIELGIDLPFMSFSSGFMDGFLNAYHDLFGFPDYGRSQRPDNAFLYDAKKDGRVVLRGQNGRTGLGDTKLSVKKPVLIGDPAMSVKGDIEFPTGDAEEGFGNGTFDAGLTLLIDKKVGERVKTYFNLGVVFPGDLKGYARVDLEAYLHAGAALEVMVAHPISLIGQVFLQGSPLPKTDIGQIDRTAVLLSLGGRYRSGNNRFEFALTEDPNTAGAPDITFNVTYRRTF